MATYALPDLWHQWQQGNLTAEQATGHILQNLLTIELTPRRPGKTGGPLGASSGAAAAQGRPQLIPAQRHANPSHNPIRPVVTPFDYRERTAL